VIGVMLALAIAMAVFVLAPLRSGAPAPRRDGEREDLLRDRETAYRSLRDLDLDYATGKVAPRDYADLRARYEDRALSVLRRLDAAPGPTALDEEQRDRGRAR
jgi:hypothetical protein